MLQSRVVFGGLVAASTLVAMLGSPYLKLASAESGGGTIRVLDDTPLSPVADIPADVRKECGELGDDMPKAIARTNRRVTLVKTPHELTEKSGKYLSVEITQVRAKQAGALTGPKRLTVRGSLVDNGKEIADFQGERGAVAAAGTCSTLEKAEKELGGAIECLYIGPGEHGGGEEQVQVVNDLIAKKVDGIAVSPSNAAARARG